MIIDGEKYACEACVRGHRVSNCQHTDRRLQHINKKGRPISQCSHCRSMRKSRSAHVKCDCGIKPNKCVHLQPTLEGHAHTCCCNHGGACTCCSSPGPTSHPAATSDADQTPSRSKSGSRARRASTVQAPARSAISKSAQQDKSALRSRTSATRTRVGSLSGRRRSASALHALSAYHLDGGSGDTTPENVTESGSPPPVEPTSHSMPDQDQALSPLDMSRLAAFPPYMHSGGFDLGSLGGGFHDNDGPLYSAGLATPTTMWGNSDPFLTSDYNDMSRGHDQVFDFAPAPDRYLDQLSELPPNLAVASSEEVSEVDENHSPGALDLGDFLQNHGGDYEGMAPQPEIFDDSPLYYTFDDEFQALGYSEESHHVDKRPEHNSYWAPSP